MQVQRPATVHMKVWLSHVFDPKSLELRAAMLHPNYCDRTGISNRVIDEPWEHIYDDIEGILDGN
jgi:hypothetical protein